MKKSKRNKNVIAPEQRIQPIGERIGHYLCHIGFTEFGKNGEGIVYTVPVFDVVCFDLYAIVNGPFIRFYAGLQTPTTKRLKRLKEIVVNELKSTLAELRRDGYLPAKAA